MGHSLAGFQKKSMASQLEKALYRLSACASGNLTQGMDPRVRLLIVIAYLIAVLSVPLLDPGRLVWMLCYPILMAEASGIGYAKVFLRSLIIIPLTVLVGIFNPILDTAAMWEIGSITISRGWVSFLSIILIILVDSIGFIPLCGALQRLGCPQVLATQLFMLYRYCGVLIEEALHMHRARVARGFGRRSYPLGMWAPFAGQLLLRSVNRAKRIHRAMAARGFNGSMPFAVDRSKIHLSEWIYLVCWISVFAALRIFDVSSMLGHFIINH